MSLISLESLSVGYGKKVILPNINISFNPMETVTFLGANGCGKTTLLKTILGVLPALSGKLIIGGIERNEWVRSALSQYIGYVPQSHNNVFPFSVEQVVLMGRTAHLSWYGTPKIEDIEKAHEILSKLGIVHLKDRPYTELSGGQRQMVLIARALTQDPQILIMDEPTASLDFGNQIRVLEQIERLKASGLTIFMTTHQPEHAASISDRIILIHEGEVIADGCPKTSLIPSHLAKIYNLSEQTIETHLKHVIEITKE